tara:strand:- start:181 stop:315 length:135 start_codon:yes stop_codon:yes gene_type:complete
MSDHGGVGEIVKRLQLVSMDRQLSEVYQLFEGAGDSGNLVVVQV